MNPLAETRVVIDAPIEKIWAVMLDVGNYSKWNPFVFRAETKEDVSKVGAAMKLYVRWKSGKGDSSDEIISDVKLPQTDADGVKRAHWGYRFNGLLHTFGLIKAVRYQWLEQLPNGTTAYSTREEFRGLLSSFIPLADVQDGFERQAKALAEYAKNNSTG
ncbi:MAG: hypothetical protein JWO06_610 [Bacteroidota bacterium]|nr:hypothetical protein [Bacteroidota bacterium]